MIYSKIGGWDCKPPPPTAKSASQGDAHMRTDPQIKFLYYPLTSWASPVAHIFLPWKKHVYGPNSQFLGKKVP